MCSFYLRELERQELGGYYHICCNMSFQLVLVVVTMFYNSNWAIILLYTVAHLKSSMSV